MSRFYKKPIATLPPRQRSFRRRKPRSGFLGWLAFGIVSIAIAWWMLSSGVPKVEKLPDGTIIEVDEAPGRAPNSASATEGKPGAPLVNFQAPVAKATAEPATAARTESDAAMALEKDFRPRQPRDVFEAQVALTRDAVCPGSIDGAWGGQTQAAVVAFQQKHGLRITGQLDGNTREKLQLIAPPLAIYTITADDLLDLRPAAKGWLERSTLDRLGFSTLLEMVAERHWANPKLIRRLNPKIEWDRLTIGTEILVPNVSRGQPRTRPTRIVIHLTDKVLELFDAESRLLAHFPCSIARRVDKRPVGDLEVVVTAPDPNYTFDPETFPDSPEAQSIGRKLILQPGPNNPVGVAWISLSLPGYGIHGSPEPEQIGRTESSGCFRLANWNASYLLPLVYPGMPVAVEP
ncbi:MAG: L,D-transpeptidase family protein [Opitutaceae bacterium]